MINGPKQTFEWDEKKKGGFHEVLKSPIARVGRVLFHGGVTERLVSKEQRINTLLQKLKDATG